MLGMELVSGVEFDATISLGNIIAGIVFIATAVGGIYAIRGNVTALQVTVEQTDKQNVMRFKSIDDESERRFAEIDNMMRDFKTEMKKLTDILIELTRQSGRMDTADARVLAQGQRLDSMFSEMREVQKMLTKLQLAQGVT